MIDEQGGVQVENETPENGAGDAWRDVVAQLEAFTEAVGRWAKAAVNDPDNKRRMEELKVGMDKIASSIGEAAGNAADTEVGQSFKEAAEKTARRSKSRGRSSAVRSARIWLERSRPHPRSCAKRPARWNRRLTRRRRALCRRSRTGPKA